MKYLFNTRLLLNFQEIIPFRWWFTTRKKKKKKFGILGKKDYIIGYNNVSDFESREYL